MTAPATADCVCDGCTLREKRVCETAAFERAIAAKSRMKLIFALAIFANDHAGLVVADFNDIRFGHEFICCRRLRQHPLVIKLLGQCVELRERDQQPQQQDIGANAPGILARGFFIRSVMAVSICGAHGVREA